VGGDADERSVLAAHLESGRVYIDDRGYERYRLCEEVVQAGSDYVTRVQRRPMAEVEPRELTAAAIAAGVLSDEIVKPGRSRAEVGEVTHPMRRIVIAGGVPQGPPRSVQPRSTEIVLLTSLVDVPAEIIAAIYRLRWSIELFFRFFKHVLGCQRLLSTKSEGISIQVYCALIAALLMSLAAGQPVGKRGFNLICLYLQGWAEEDELIEGLQRIVDSKKKS
jgi:IS4 transposase